MADSISDGEILALLRASGVPDSERIVAERPDEVRAELELTRTFRDVEFDETPPATTFAVQLP